ncbi:MAG: NAD(P)-dependent oxidoreductase, partial [Burkholderiales bacterium]|nr:NAD(P)-dependent oxidoreductase [Burkholderiales bacterium]
QVSYTPEPPAPAVAEMTVGLMLNLLRHVHIANAQMHQGVWHRYFGRRISEVTVGIIGLGRIGGRVLEKLSLLGAKRILVNDLSHDIRSQSDVDFEWVVKDKIFCEADLISVHVPLSPQTRNMICYEQLKKMKSNAIVINTSRGGIINEYDLAKVLTEGHLSGAAVDVFEDEPYFGDLTKIERCLLTSHMGSMSVDCRAKMEIEATREVVRFFSGDALISAVPRGEYDGQKHG